MLGLHTEIHQDRKMLTGTGAATKTINQKINFRDDDEVVPGCVSVSK